MCGRYTLISSQGKIQGAFDVKLVGFEWITHFPRYNIAPSQGVLVVVNSPDQTPEDIEPSQTISRGARVADLFRWGLIPFWAKDPAIGNRMINARAETLAEKPAFRTCLRKKRCLVIADGFYEWRANAGKKVPMRITLKSGEPFAFAGLWDEWKAPTGEPVRSCTIITTTPNELIADIHNRMPVILESDAEKVWLDPDVENAGLLTSLLTPYPADGMMAYQVLPLVNSPKNDIPECIAPVR